MCSGVVKTSLKELVENPDKYVDKKVEVRAVLILLGKSPRGPIYSINLPEDEDYCVGLLKVGDLSLLCYGLEELPFEEYNNREVIVVGRILKVHGFIILKAIEIRIVS